MCEHNCSKQNMTISAFVEHTALCISCCICTKKRDMSVTESVHYLQPIVVQPLNQYELNLGMQHLCESGKLSKDRHKLAHLIPT